MDGEADVTSSGFVSRKRRAWITVCTIAACLTMSYSLAMRGEDTKVAQIVAEGMIQMAGWALVAYIGTSSIDYSLGGALPAFLSRKRREDEDPDDDGEPERPVRRRRRHVESEPVPPPDRNEEQPTETEERVYDRSFDQSKKE